MKKIILPLLCLFSILSSTAQNKRDKIKVLKVAFITEKLDLTEKEAQQFWPIYNAHEEVAHRIKHEEIRKIRREIKKNLPELTEARSKELLTRLMSAENNLAKEHSAFISKIKTVIPAKKIIQLKVAEEDFRRRMLQEFKKRGQP